MFRKFFYENSSFIENQAIFAEITDPILAREELGLDNDHKIAAVQTKNELSSFHTSNAELFKCTPIEDRKVFTI